MKNTIIIAAIALFALTTTSCQDASAIVAREAKKNPPKIEIVKVVTPPDIGIITKLTTEEFKKAIDDKQGTLVDVRTPEEFAEGHLKGAVNINFKKRTFPSYISAIAKDTPVLIYCRSGNRSSKAALIMQALGFTEVLDLAKGYKGWNADKQAISNSDNKANIELQVSLKENAPKPAALKHLGTMTNVDENRFEQLINEGKLTLVDVRKANEFAEGHIEGAINIDWKNRHFAKNIQAVTNDKPVAIYCRSGNRSTRAMYAMTAIGFNEVINLNKGYKSWVAAKKPIKTLEVKGDIRHLDSKNFNNAMLGQVGTLIDVRTPKEYEDAHIIGAINIDFKNSNFKSKFSELDKEQPVLIYCRSGGRSGRAMKVLEGLGFKVYNLDDGFLDWKTNNMKIEGKNIHAQEGGEEGC